MLRVHNISKSFGGLAALSDCTFSVTPNSVTGIVGPNGAGKSTLFDVVTGYLHPDSGEVLFGETNITNMAPYSIARFGVARTFQRVRVFKELSVLDNLRTAHWQPAIRLIVRAFRPQGQRSGFNSKLEELSQKLLRRVQLDGVSDVPTGQLSYGQQKIVELLRVIVRNPLLALIDEPVSGLDPLMREEMGRLILELRRSGATVVLIEHDLDFVRRFCEHVLVLDQGTPIYHGPPNMLEIDDLVRERYLDTGAYL